MGKVATKSLLVRNAFEEALRYEGPVQVFFRTTVRETKIGDLPIGRSQKVAAFMASANRDPRRWTHPDRFDVERRAAGHTALGTGIHGCVGQAVARPEGEAVFGALVRKVKSIELTAEPTRRYNKASSGFPYGSIQLEAQASDQDDLHATGLPSDVALPPGMSVTRPGVRKRC